MIAFAALASLALPLLSTAQLVPTAPGPGDVFKQGAACAISWTADTSGKWGTTFIELMTGPNQQMVHLATVASVDGTNPTNTSISFTCPSVTPNSAIYFYQFTAQGQNVTWTGRFAISDPSGATTPPPNASQPDGENIPWGTGKLLDASQGSPPPPTAPAGQIDGSGSSAAPASASSSGSSSASSVAPAGSSAASIPPAAAPPTSAPASSSNAATNVGASSPTVSPAPASNPSTAPPNTTTAPNGALANSLSAATALAAAAILGLSLC